MATRKYELDWLRIIVFALLIFYHVSMYFNPWGWHIKNDTLYQWTQIPLLALNQWRLEMLFLISGMGTYFSLQRRTKLQYSWERMRRLGLPLVFGMLVIIPPQVYIERVINEGLNISYWEYWTTIGLQGVYPEGNFSWHHLWFLPYLLSFSLLLIPLLALVKSHTLQRLLDRMALHLRNQPWKIYWFIAPLVLVEATLSPLFPVEPKLIGDWYAFTHYFLLFTAGFAFMHISDTFFATCGNLKRKALLVACMAFVGQLGCFYGLPGNKVGDVIQSVLEIVYLWSVIVAIFGYAVQHLSQGGRHLPYLNEAVYPFYILHQTVLMVLIYLGSGWFGSDSSFFVFLVVGTFSATWVLYEGIRRINPLRPFFGLKRKFRAGIAKKSFTQGSPKPRQHWEIKT